MPTLHERCQTVRDMVGRLATADEDKGRFGQLRTRAAQVQEASDELEAARRAVRLLSARGLLSSNLPRPSAALRGKAPVLRANLMMDWRAFANDRSLPNTFVEPVKAYAARLQEAALVAWCAHVDTGLPTIRDSLISALAAAGFQNKCTQLRQLLADVSTLRRSCPESAADFQRIDELKAAIQAVWSELDGVPADVVGFLKKAAHRSATIDDLSPGIRAWLSDHAMLGQLRIGLG